MSRYEQLLALLDGCQASYRVLEHEPEGRTERASALRGHPVEHAAKAMVVMVKLGKRTTRHVLAVVPGASRVDLARVRDAVGGTYAAVAAPEVAEELSGSVVGTVLPFSFDPRLELIVDPSVLAAPELFFNAGRLDRSLALRTDDYRRVATPRLERIARRDEMPASGGGQA